MKSYHDCPKKREALLLVIRKEVRAFKKAHGRLPKQKGFKVQRCVSPKSPGNGTLRIPRPGGNPMTTWPEKCPFL